MIRIRYIHLAHAERDDGGTQLARFSVDIEGLVYLNGLRLIRNADGVLEVGAGRQESRRHGSVYITAPTRVRVIEAANRAFEALRASEVAA